jgi:hypothetical protein
MNTPTNIYYGLAEAKFIFPECGGLSYQHHYVKVLYVYLVRKQGFGIGIRSETDSFVLTLTHLTSVQATVHIGTNEVCRIGLVFSNWFAVRNWRQKGRAS